uniref:Uncharacterized protein n=1 Tax=Oryza meridionalis TaxID=40149 RepID=A0A0E0EY81_9ORYZ
MSDYVCCLYGQPGAYGVVTLPFSVREGINIFLAGFIPTENLRLRDESLTFKGTRAGSANGAERNWKEAMIGPFHGTSKKIGQHKQEQEHGNLLWNLLKSQRGNAGTAEVVKSDQGSYTKSSLGMDYTMARSIMWVFRHKELQNDQRSPAFQNAS